MSKYKILPLLFLSLSFTLLLSGSGAYGLEEDVVDLSVETCMLCHEEESPNVDLDVFQGSVHGSFDCIDCHGDIEDIPHSEQLEPVNCSLCHDEVASAFEMDIHRELNESGMSDLPNCSSCHGVHNIYPVTDLRSLANRLQSDETCLTCHGDPAVAQKHPKMPPNVFFTDYQNSVHSRAIHKKGLVVSATCIDCHGVHGIRPKSDPASPVHRTNLPQTCNKCHLGIFAEYKESVHGKLWLENSETGPVCTTCHESHNIQDSQTKDFRAHMPQQCGGCHAEKSRTYSDTFHGKATSLGYQIGATCADCHTAHRNLPSDDPLSSTHPLNLIKTCAQCHENMGANFVGYDPHMDIKDSHQSGPVHSIYVFMEALLLSVFVFWGLHTLLWFQRSLVGVLRGEIKKEAEGTQYIRRFSPNMMKLHTVIVISFLGLVATGLPLKYHFAGWAQWLISIHGGIEITRLIHRILAIVTFGYCFFHVVDLFWQVVFKRQKRLLFGPDSFVPRWKDFTDFFENMRWFLYMGKQPAFGRWTYFEKFDYFAVFWGVPVIGLSGLIMWFPGFFTRFLPGYFLNIAQIVHSEEALLAAAFIFTVHFFHNHLRPENFPMDISIFTGKISLERFKSERPEEYEQLVRENRLDALFTSAPTDREKKHSFLFGSIAVVIGLGLVTGIIAAVVF